MCLNSLHINALIFKEFKHNVIIIIIIIISTYYKECTLSGHPRPVWTLIYVLATFRGLPFQWNQLGGCWSHAGNVDISQSKMQIWTNCQWTQWESIIMATHFLTDCCWPAPLLALWYIPHCFRLLNKLHFWVLWYEVLKCFTWLISHSAAISFVETLSVVAK